MPWLSENQRNRAFRMVQARMAQNTVAKHFGVHQNTIQSLWRRFQQSGNTRNWPRSMHHHVTSLRQDNHCRLLHLRNRFKSARLTARCIPGLRPISSWTVRNRLCECNIRPRRPAVRPILVQRHRTAIPAYVVQTTYVCRNTGLHQYSIHKWTQFHLRSSDGCYRVHRRVGERY